MQSKSSALLFGASQTYQRPSEADPAIDALYQSTVTDTGEKSRSYLFTGNETYGIAIDKISTNSKIILDQTVKTTPTELEEHPITALDVGAGDFQFVSSIQKQYKGKVRAYGIAANDNYRKKNNRVTDEFHRIANAEYLSKAFGENQFDFIFSHATYMHLCDPIGSIIEAYKTLKPGGILLIDKFNVRGCEQWTRNIICYLKDMGYEVIAGSCHQEINNFVIKKPADNSKPNLVFPVLYDGISSGGYVQYKPNPELLKVNRQYDEAKRQYTDGCKIALEEAQKINKNLLERCQTLPELFLDPEYLNYNDSIKRSFILAVTAKTMNYDELQDLCKSCEEIDTRTTRTKPFKKLLSEIKENSRYYLYELGTSNNIFFKSYQSRAIAEPNIYDVNKACEQQLNIILIAAMEGIIAEQRVGETKASFESLNLPCIDKGKDPLLGYGKKETEKTKFLDFPQIAAWHQRNLSQVNASQGQSLLKKSN